MSQEKLNPATGYVHDDSQLETKPEPAVEEQTTEEHHEETHE